MGSLPYWIHSGYMQFFHDIKEKLWLLLPRSSYKAKRLYFERLRKQQLVESLEHMSPIYLEGIKRILTVSADTELISAPAYYHAAVYAPTLNNFGSVVSIIQDELGHAHIAYRLLRDLALIPIN